MIFKLWHDIYEDLKGWSNGTKNKRKKQHPFLRERKLSKNFWGDTPPRAKRPNPRKKK